MEGLENGGLKEVMVRDRIGIRDGNGRRKVKVLCVGGLVGEGIMGVDEEL